MEDENKKLMEEIEKLKETMKTFSDQMNDRMNDQKILNQNNEEKFNEICLMNEKRFKEMKEEMKVEIEFLKKNLIKDIKF